MSFEIAKKVKYVRLENGLDLYMLKTTAKDVITCRIGLPGGDFSTYDKQALSILTGDMLPSGTKNKNKKEVLDTFKSIGAEVSIHFGRNIISISLASRKRNFVKAFNLLLEILLHPSFPKSEFSVSVSRLSNVLQNSLEDTNYQAENVLLQSLFKKGHPHWKPTPAVILNDIKKMKHSEVKSFYNSNITSIGGIACITGDIGGREFFRDIRNALNNIPSNRTEKKELQPNNIHTNTSLDKVMYIKDKLNVDMYLGIPLTITRESSDFDNFVFGIKILGDSFTSRLSHVLRSERSLTYGARGVVSGTETGYPPYIKCYTLLPNTVFKEGRKVLRDVVKDFAENGVTINEVRDRKQEVVGSFKVGISTTKGLCNAMFGTLINNRELSEIDTFSDKIHSMTTGEINKSLFNSIDFSLAKTAAAGAVRPDGTPKE